LSKEKRGESASRAQWLASRQTHLHPTPFAQNDALRINKSKSDFAGQKGSAARDAPRHDRDGRAPKSFQSRAQSNQAEPMLLAKMPGKYMQLIYNECLTAQMQMLRSGPVRPSSTKNPRYSPTERTPNQAPSQRVAASHSEICPEGTRITKNKHYKLLSMCSLRSFAAKISQENACEIFHDAAVSPPVSSNTLFKDRRDWCSLDAMVKSMRLIKITVLLMVLAGLSLAGLQAQTTSPASASVPTAAPAAPATKSEGLPSNALTVFHIGLFPVTNSMLVTWIVALGIICFARYATRRMKEIPDGAQNFWEFLVEGLHDFLAEIVGADLIKKTFWFFATIFIFICFTNWCGLVPGVGTIGWGADSPNGFDVTRPLLRGGNADLNMTFAMASIFMVLWFIWALQSNGIWGFVLHIFGPKGDNQGAMKYAMIVVFFAVGLIEVMSIAFRPISLSFRLFGNIFAGENLMDAMSHLIQHPAWARALCSVIIPIPFYFMELMVGFVQAIVFMLLTAGFTSVICMHDDDAHAKGQH
jgi:F-type H+-transporting ATPase subunit a